jgi:hypothetical protein
VEQRGTEQVGIVVAGTQQLLCHVESVAAVGDRHGREQPRPTGRQDALHQRELGGFHPGAHVSHDLPDPMHRSGPA